MHEDPADCLRAQALAKKLEEAVGILTRVIGQTERWVLQGETVPAGEKAVSFFESHTDILVRSRRETQYGHKVFLTVNATISGTKLTLVELKTLCAPNSEAA